MMSTVQATTRAAARVTARELRHEISLGRA